MSEPAAGTSRVIVVEDDVLMREGIAQVLRAARHDVVGTAGDAPHARSLVMDLRPDVLVTDIRIPPDLTDDGLRVAIELRRTTPGLAVMVLSQFVQRAYALELVGDEPAGVGYLLKQRVADVARFTAAVQEVADGGTVLDPRVVQAMLEVTRTEGRADLDALTARQRDVLALVAEGRSNQAIAERLTIAEKTVVQYVSRIYDVFGLPPSGDDHRRVLAVLRYLNQ